MSKKYQLKRLSTRRYQLLAAILILLAGGLVLLPDYQKHEGIEPQLFINKAMSNERFISTDIVADKIINKDPSVLLIDVRPESEFVKFSLPNAINIPLAKFFDEEYDGVINQDILDIVLFSNDNFHANEAWLLANRLGYTNLYVMKGGLNEWFNTIVFPKMPEETMPREAFELYTLRKAAGLYFGIGTTEVPEVKPVIKSAPAAAPASSPVSAPVKVVTE
jgi:rhodanese-related sulfurtransferase